MIIFKKKKDKYLDFTRRSLELPDAAYCHADKLLESLETDRLAGLSAQSAEERQAVYGDNSVGEKMRSTRLKRVIAALINPFNIVLMAVAAITFLTDVILSDSKDYLTALIILILIAVSSAISFVQAEKSGLATEKLSKMVRNTSSVLRDGTLREIDTKLIVPGDIIKLSAGDIIPCDVRFIAAKDAFVSQAALTGESLPVEKFAHAIKEDKAVPETDYNNIGYMGSNMVSGSALCVAVRTGAASEFGKIAAQISTIKNKNSFEQGVESVSRLLIRFMLITVPAVFILNVLVKKDFSTSLLFAVTVAVGLTPEMLPVVMTTTLSKGALTMSRLKTIVKSPSAVQTLGEIDVLCTDKTGTLTEDRIVLEKYMNVHGNDDRRVLRHAFLNSRFQTGLKNLIDLAIIERAESYNLSGICDDYNVVDEIPFDFARRRMSVILKDNAGKRQLITKGAVEEMLEVCSHVEYNGQIMPLEGELLQKTQQVYRKHNDDGLRILAVAQKNYIKPGLGFTVQDERELVLIGFVGFLDPPKESAAESILALKNIGVRVAVLTGDSMGVAKRVCEKVGVNASYALTGADVEGMDDTELLHAAKNCDLFAKLNPLQKQRIIHALQSDGHTVGFLGDGINDAPALKQADVGISVDSAVDIAKETADIILLEKDLMVLERGVEEGRKTFGNIIKYIKMAASGNLGNIISVIAATLLLPFFPLLPVHIMVQNLLCDFSQLGIPFDRVDKSYIQSPRRWDTGSLARFMVIFGVLSSVFDLACFAVLWYVLGANAPQHAALFHAGWFLYGTLSQILVVHIIRTDKSPFFKSRASLALILSGAAIGALTLFIVFSPAAIALDMATLTVTFLPYLALLLLGYLLFTEIAKRIYIKRTGSWM